MRLAWPSSTRLPPVHPEAKENAMKYRLAVLVPAVVFIASAAGFLRGN